MTKQSSNEIKKPIRVKIEKSQWLFNFEKMRVILKLLASSYRYKDIRQPIRVDKYRKNIFIYEIKLFNLN